MKTRLLAVPPLVFLALTLNCGRVTDAASWFVSDEQEIELGRQYHEQLLQDTTLQFYSDNPNHNPALVTYIESIGQLLADSQQTRPDFPFNFYIIDNDSTINAFALPGGYIYMYTGLIDSAKTEAEIAGVLAHEIGHVTERHGVKRLVQRMGIDFVFDLVLGDSTSFRKVADVVGGLAGLNYSKDQEYEADSLSVDYLIAAGYNPMGMRDFMNFLASKQGFVFEPLSTHPDGEKRVAAIDTLISHRDSSVKDLPYYIIESEIPQI